MDHPPFSHFLPLVNELVDVFETVYRVGQNAFNGYLQIRVCDVRNECAPTIRLTGIFDRQIERRH